VIEIRQGDITTLAVDAIVNAANPSLLGGGGVDGAIHRAAGSALRKFNRTLGGCPTGEARISPGFDLPARHVISTVGPVWHGGDQGESQLLENAYRNSLELARQHGIRTIAFPAISIGVYAFPREQAARIALQVMKEYEPRFERIIAVLHSSADAERYRRILAELEQEG